MLELQLALSRVHWSRSRNPFLHLKVSGTGVLSQGAPNRDRTFTNLGKDTAGYTRGLAFD